MLINFVSNDAFQFSYLPNFLISVLKGSMAKKLFIIYILAFLVTPISYAQSPPSSNKLEPTYYISLNFGTQMSGIKDEDFISSNYSPLLNITAGKWFTPYIALQIGYKGFYFYTIADEIKHHYNYLYGEAVINFNELVDPNRTNKNWNMLLHGGPGYFYNHVYGRASLHLTLGIQNTIRLSDQIHASIDVASIVGWDIYQGDEDILPGITIGLTYNFALE